MGNPLKLLILGDSVEDAELIVRELGLAGWDPDWRRADDEADYLRQLTQPTDLIIADYAPARLSAPRALRLLNERGLKIPLIIVSGHIGEEPAVECMKSGAADYLLKDRLASIGPAVEQALDRKRRRDDVRFAQDALRESERTLSSLISNLPGMVYRSVPEPYWAFTYASEGCLSLTGYQADEVTRKPLTFEQLIHEDDLDAVVEKKSSALRRREPFQLEYRISTSARESKWVWERGRAHYSPEGRVLFVEGFITDISERKFAEDHLARQRNLLETILRQAADAIVVCDIDGNLTFVNAAARRLAQIDPETTSSDVGAEVWGVPHDPDGRPIPFEQWPLALALCGQVTVGREVRLIRRDGSHCDLLISAAPLRNADQIIVGAVSTFADITERKAAEMRLGKLSRQHQLILTSAGEGIYGVDREGKTTFVNPAAAEMTGFGIDELIGKHQHDILHHTRPDGSPYPREDCLIYAAFRDGQVRQSDAEVFWRKDGTSFPVAYTSTPIRDEQDELIGAVVTFRDITEQKRLEEKLRQAAKMEALGQLAGGVAHDFNNLLTVICAYAEILLMRCELNEQARAHIEEISGAGERAAALTGQLLTFSRQEITQPTEVDINQVVGDCSKMLKRLLGEDVAMRTRLAPSIGLIRIDPGQLEQVIMNLVVNARDAMPDGGTLTIETANTDLPGGPTEGDAGPARPAVRLSVRDTGHGMDEKTRARIFEPFFTTKEQGKGTGLGLATVYGIIMECGGTMDVDSAPGRGACFNIHFPMIEEEEGPAEAVRHPSVLAGGTETILVVEDEVHLRRVVRHVLSEAGYEVLEAANGEQAHKLCLSHPGPIHVLLTDVVMPGINGRRLSEVLVAARPDLKVLYMSGYSDDIVLRHGVQQGSAAFIRKPFTGDSLTTAIREALKPRG